MSKIKINEMHNGLDKSHIRDFLSKSLTDLLNSECDASKKKKPPTFNEEDPFQWAIDQAKNEIDFWKIQLEKATAKKSIIQLIKMNNWEEHDVSEYIRLEEGQIFSPTFIGTKEEFQALFNKKKTHE